MKTICLDPGHGGNGNLTTYGAVGFGLQEKNIVLSIAKYTRDYLLNDYDCRVVMTRDGDYDVSFAGRADVARYANADLLMSFHLNGYHIQSANGFETFIFSGSVQPQTHTYQHAIHNEIFDLLNEWGIRDRGKKRANFAILRLPPCPCVLAEYLFVTNHNEAEMLRQPGHIKALGEATAKGIVKALDLPVKKPTFNMPTETPPIQRTIGVLLNGENTGEVGYLINNATYIRAVFASRLADLDITGHGGYINIKK